MKKTLLFSVIILLVHTSSLAQDGLIQFSKSYFRSDPLSGSFSGFLKHLMNDPALKNKQTRQRTDTSLFYFSGIYLNYNPFFFKPTRVEITLAEVPIQYTDSIPADTILVYQLLAYADSSHAGGQDVKKEFAKIHRQYNRKFYDSNYQDLKNGEKISGGIHNYFIGTTRIAPVTVAWGKLSNEYVLSLLLRVKQKGNMALLPAALYNPQ